MNSPIDITSAPVYPTVSSAEEWQPLIWAKYLHFAGIYELARIMYLPGCKVILHIVSLLKPLVVTSVDAETDTNVPMTPKSLYN